MRKVTVQRIVFYLGFVFIVQIILLNGGVRLDRLEDVFDLTNIGEFGAIWVVASLVKTWVLKLSVKDAWIYVMILVVLNLLIGSVIIKKALAFLRVEKWKTS